MNDPVEYMAEHHHYDEIAVNTAAAIMSDPYNI